jgi:hypothetical protein
MKATDLRIGNYHYYLVKDHLDKRKEWNEVFQIDALDLVKLSEIEDLNYQPIPLTEEWLKKLGFKLVFAGQGDGYIYEYGELCKTLTIHSRDRNKFLYSTFNSCEKHIQYVHQLQNLYFALTNEELTLTK